MNRKQRRKAAKRRRSLPEILAGNSRSGHPDLDKSGKGKPVAKEKGRISLGRADLSSEIDTLTLDGFDDPWAWMQGRGRIAVQPVFSSDTSRRGILMRQGLRTKLFLRGSSEANTLDNYPKELEAVKNADQDFLCEVVVINEGEHFKILLIDLLFWGDNVHGSGFFERREKLVDFGNKNLIGSGRFEILGVTWITSMPQLQEEVSAALKMPGVDRVLLKSGEGVYPGRGTSPDWYEITRNRDSLKTGITKQLDSVSLLAAAALGYRVQEAPVAKEVPPENELDLKNKVEILKADEERQIVIGVVLEPLRVDAQEDIMVPRDIEDTAHDYLVNRRVVGFRHSEEAEAVVIESYIAPVDFNLNGQDVIKGSWILGVKVLDLELWRQIKSGELNGFSIGGFGRREELA